MKLQRKHLLIAVGILTAGAIGFFVYQYDLIVPKPLGAELTIREGKVEYRTSASKPWQTTTSDISLPQGASVRTGSSSRAVINLDDGSAIRLNASSTAHLATLNSKHILIENRGGQVYTRVTKSAKRVFEVKTSKTTYRSLGTAYRTIDTPELEGVEVYHSKVNVLGLNTSGNVIVEQGERFYRVDRTEPTLQGKVTEISREDIATDTFLQWNTDQDRKEFESELGVLFDIKPPALEVSTPAAGLVTSSETLDVTGTTEAGAKVLINGQAATNTGGQFAGKATLAVGPNALKIESIDGAGNKTVKTITVTRTAPVAASPAPSATPIPAAKKVFSLYGTRVDSGISFSWSISGYDASKGFKLVKSSSANPVYPGNSATYIDAGARSYTWGIKDGSTYHFRICTYTGSGCSAYSNDITVTAPAKAAEAQPSGTVTLSHTGGNNFSWVLNGSAPYGYKLVWSNSTGPVYPGSSYNYYSSGTSGNITSDPGFYYVRVCMYTGGGCTNYSNELTVTIP